MRKTLAVIAMLGALTAGAYGQKTRIHLSTKIDRRDADGAGIIMLLRDAFARSPRYALDPSTNAPYTLYVLSAPTISGETQIGTAFAITLTRGQHYFIMTWALACGNYDATCVEPIITAVDNALNAGN
jgi:hypothetical protein